MSTVEVPSLLFHSSTDFYPSSLLSFPSTPTSPVSIGDAEEMQGRLPSPSHQQRQREQADTSSAVIGHSQHHLHPHQPQQPPLHPYAPSYPTTQPYARTSSASSFPYLPSGTSLTLALPSYPGYPSPPLHSAQGEAEDASFDESLPLPLLSDGELPPMSNTPPPIDSTGGGGYGSGGELYGRSHSHHAASTSVYTTAQQAYTVTHSPQPMHYAPTASPPLYSYRSQSPQYGSGGSSGGAVKAEYNAGPLSPSGSARTSSRTYYPPPQPVQSRSSSSNSASPRQQPVQHHIHHYTSGGLSPMSVHHTHYNTVSAAAPAVVRTHSGGHSPTVASAVPASYYPPPTPPSHLLNILSATLQVNARNALPSDDILAEAARQLGVSTSGGSSAVVSPASASPSSSSSNSPSLLTSPRHLSPSASPLPSGAVERRLIRMDIQSLTSLLLAVAATATGGRGGLVVSQATQPRQAEPAAAYPSSSAAAGHPSSSSVSTSYLATHRASLPSLLPSIYSPHQVHERDTTQSQFERHSSRSRSKSRRRHKSASRRNRSATPSHKEEEYGEDEQMSGEPKLEGGHGDMQMSSAMSVTEEVADQFGSLSFDESESEMQRPTPGEMMVRGGARRRSVSARQGARDRSRSLSTKRKRAIGEESFLNATGQDEQAGEEGYSSLSSYDSDDDSVDELDTATIASQLPANPSASTSPQSGGDPLSPPSNSGQPKRRPGRPAKAGGPNRPRPRTQYSPLTAEQKEERVRVRQYLAAESLTQSDLARVCGVSKASMCTWLQGATSRAMHQRIWARVVDWMAEVDRSEGGTAPGGGTRVRSVASSSSSGGGSSSSSCSSTSST